VKLFVKINKKEDRNKLLNFNKELPELQMRSESASNLILFQAKYNIIECLQVSIGRSYYRLQKNYDS
jgi:hypothetical protein